MMPLGTVYVGLYRTAVEHLSIILNYTESSRRLRGSRASIFVVFVFASLSIITDDTVSPQSLQQPWLAGISHRIDLLNSNTLIITRLLFKTTNTTINRKIQ